MAARKKTARRRGRVRKEPRIVYVMALEQCFIDNKLREPGQKFEYDEANWGPAHHPDSPVVKLRPDGEPDWEAEDAPLQPSEEEGVDGVVNLPWVTGQVSTGVPGTV